MNKNNRFDNPVIKPPLVTKHPTAITQHGETRQDNYAWLRDDNWQQVLREPALLRPDIKAMLDSENQYYAALTEDLELLRGALFSEMKGRIKEDDASPPASDGDYEYWTEHRPGGEYPVYMRRNKITTDVIQLYDGDKERGEGIFFDIGFVKHSPNHKLIAHATDKVGSEYFEVRFRDIKNGRDRDDALLNVDGGGLAWSADSQHVFYVERDEFQRPKRVKRHRLGSKPSLDVTVYEETDESFFVHIEQTHSRAFILIVCGDHVTSEVRYISAYAPEEEPQLIAAREEGIQYSVTHHDENFYILTNADDAVDFKIVSVPVQAPSRNNWSEWLPHIEGRYIVRITAYRDFIVRLERRDALPHIVVSDYDGVEFEISFDEAAYSIGVLPGFEFVTDIVRFSYESPSTPPRIYDYNVRTRERLLVKEQEVPSGHDPSLYVVERIQAKSTDGASVPVTVLRLKTTEKNGSAAALLYGYGSYGHTVPAAFSSSILSLVDRGMVYAITHPRGGAAKGRQWYLDGKLEKKSNTFADVNASAEVLVTERYAAKKKIVVYGGSAGGLLVGAAVNLRQDLYAGVLAAVPFVDVLTTISDPELPLTPPEWNEWGNPIEDRGAYDAIKEYSPYDNIQNVEYPPIMATGGLADFRVTYWEPAKWIARLRDEAKGGPFVLRMNMEAGHAGAAARFEAIKERAHLYAFALKALGMVDAQPGANHESA